MNTKIFISSLLLSHSLIYAKTNSLIFWSDFNFINNNQKDYKILNKKKFNFSEEPPTINPSEPTIPPIVIPPVVIPPTEPPITPIPPIEEPKYIFYDDIFYKGNNLHTNNIPLNGDILLNTSNKIGMGTIKDNYILTNENIINIEQNNDFSSIYGMEASNGGTVINNNSININSFLSVGMSTFKSGNAQNTSNGVININNLGTGILVFQSGNSENSGVINLANEQSSGVTLENTDNNGYFLNKGIIKGFGRFGAYLHGNGTIINDSAGQIEITNGLSGIFVEGSGFAKNLGTINLVDSRYGMYVTNGGKILNDGTINLSTLDLGNNTLILFNGGIVAENSGTAINETNGIINVGTPSIQLQGYNAMSGIGDVNLINDGTINVFSAKSKNNLVSETSYAFSLQNGAIAENHGTINLNEYALLNRGGIVHNWGVINKSSNSTLPLSTENGEIIYEKGSKINFQTKNINLGRSYISNLYSKSGFIDIDSSLVKNSDNIKFKSPLYELKKSGNNLSYKKINFSNYFSNDIGNYLENSFYNSNNQNKDKIFESILSSNSQKEAINRFHEIIGKNYFTSLIYQTKDAISFGNTSLIDNLIKNNQLKKESYIFGYSFGKVNKGTYRDIGGYKEDLNTLFLGKNYILNNNLSFGVIGNYTRLDSNFKDSEGMREDNIFQGTSYLNYSKNNLTSTIGGFLGYSKGDLDRTINLNFNGYNKNLTQINSYNITENLNSEIENFYFGSFWQLSKDYDFNSFYLKPEARFESILLLQKGIDENSKNYNINLDKVNAWYNTLYFGGDFGKIFTLNDKQLNLALRTGIKQEVNQAKENLNIKLTSLSDENLNLKAKNYNRFSKEIGIKAEISNIPTGLSLYAEYKYIFSQDNSWNLKTGIKYIF